MSIHSITVSVIITSYNQKKLLIEAVESVLHQTVLPHEIIIADDCSTDGSKKVIQEYQERYPNLVKILSHSKNLGIPQNRNSALEQVTGSHVAILDGDDKFLPEKIEYEIRAFQRKTNLAAVYSNFYFIDKYGEIIRVRNDQPMPSGYIFQEVFQGLFGMLRSMLIDYSILKEIGFLDENFWHLDGFDLTIRIAKIGEIDYIKKPLSAIRLHSGGAAGWRKPSHEMKDLEGIFQKNQKLLSDLDPQEIRKIERAWEKRNSLFVINIAKEKKQYLKGMKIIIRSFLDGKISIMKSLKLFYSMALHLFGGFDNNISK